MCAFELAGCNAAADAWRERCESQEAVFAEHQAAMGSATSDAREEAEKWCGSLHEAMEDIGRWRGRVQELHAERQHMESALEALARARNSWRAKAEATERQLQSALVASSSKAECMVQENQLQSQAEIAAVHSQFSELRMQSQTDMQRAREKWAAAEQQALESAREDTLAMIAEAGALRASLSEAVTRSDALEHQCEASQEKMATQVDATAAVHIKLQQAQREFNSAEAGTEFLHRELSRTRRISEQVKEAVTVEQSDAVVSLVSLVSLVALVSLLALVSLVPLLALVSLVCMHTVHTLQEMPWPFLQSTAYVYIYMYICISEVGWG